jgi:predicted lipid-binding transport protein (Tim44 family)
MFKKLALILVASMMIFSVTAPGMADAKSRGSYKSPKSSIKPEANKTTTPTNNATKPDAASSTKTTPTSPATAAQKPGFFSGGLMKGLLIGGLAGMLFGGLFGGLGALGNILGFLVNIAAIFVLVALVIRVVAYFRNRKKLNNEPKHNH